ncbi:hypothetical protein QYE76_067477 [Lolium multiflorum]|uniref:WPP domain-containing protein n=1 Tax=Lolium multiflorum TaxID=4521 RepID=A0AAD8SCN9_LOLMU|nr:hypothetical protein QYE76_067477 [Lolium multiflorum]
MGPDELSPATAGAGNVEAAPFSFNIWPPRTRDAAVWRLVDTLAGDTLLCNRYGAVPALAPARGRPHPRARLRRRPPPSLSSPVAAPVRS